MNELTVVDPPKVPLAANLKLEGHAPTLDVARAPDINILMSGQRLEITANVDLEGVAKLKEALGKYEELLKLLQ